MSEREISDVHICNKNISMGSGKYGELATYEIIMPNVMRLPSSMIKLPLCEAGEHSA